MNILFLDDMPERVQQIRTCDSITYVRTVQEFMDYLKSNPLPDVMSFDHDLAPEHYVVSTGYHGSYTAPNGADIARWCVEAGYLPTIVVVHSWNSDGAKEIASIFLKVLVKKPLIVVSPFNPDKVLFEP